MKKLMITSHRFSESAKNLIGNPIFEVLAAVQELKKNNKSIIHFEIGDPNFNTPTHIGEAAVKAIRRGETHYVDPSGILELRQAISNATKRDLGWQPELNQIIVAPAKSFIYFLVKVLMNNGEEVIICDPAYPAYFSVFNFTGVKAVTVPTFEKNGFCLRSVDLEKFITQKTRLLILNSPQNPTGAIIPRKELAKIYRIAEKHNFYVLSDEVYDKIVYDRPHTSITEQDRCQKLTILLNSFSKTYAMTGWRLGYVVAPKEIAKKLSLMIETVISNVPSFIQRAGISALTGDQSGIKSMIEEYRKRRNFMVDGLNKLPKISCIMPDGAFYAFPNISKTGLSSKKFAELMLKKAGVALLPGTDFGAYGEGYARVTFAISMDDIKEGLVRMDKVLKDL